MLNHKITYIILLFIIFPLFGSSQILSLEEFTQYTSDREPLPENWVYIKDVNNSLAPYIGTWSSVFDQNAITFTVSKVTVPYGGSSTKLIDKLYIDFKIVDVNSAVIIDTSTMPDFENPRLEGSKINSIAYSGRWYYTENGDYLCNTSGFFFLKVIRERYTANQLEVVLHEPSTTVTAGDCPNGYSATPLPKEVEFRLIKQ